MLSLLSTSADVAQEAEDGGRGRDAVLMRIDRLGDAPRALADVIHLVAHQDWRVLNVLQIREAAALGGALSAAARSLRKIRRALLQLSRARDALMEALPRIRRSYGDLALPDDTRFRDLCIAANFMAVIGWTYGVGTGYLRDEVDSQVGIVRDVMPEPKAVPKAFRKRSSSHEYRLAAGPPLYAELLALLVSLRDAQRKVDRRLPRILPVVASLQEQAARDRDGGATHGVTRQSPGMRAIAAEWASALAAPSLRDSTFDDVLPRIAVHLQQLQDSLNAPVPLLYDRFTGDVVVRSLRDVAEVRTNSRLLLNSADEPSHRIIIVLDGLRMFSEANELRLHLLAGVDECGWRVARGLPQLEQAALLYDAILKLKAALEKAHTADVYNAAADQYFTECRDRAAELQDLFDSDRTVVSSGANALLLDVDNLAENQLHEKLFLALEQLNILCTEDVSFIHA